MLRSPQDFHTKITDILGEGGGASEPDFNEIVPFDNKMIDEEERDRLKIVQAR